MVDHGADEAMPHSWPLDVRCSSWLSSAAAGLIGSLPDAHHGCNLAVKPTFSVVT